MGSLLHRPAVVAGAALLAACGARTSPRTDLGGHGGAGTTSSAGGGGGSSTTTTTSSSTGGAAPCLSWKVGAPAPIPLTDSIGDSQLTGVAVEGDRVFVATTNNNDPSPDPTWRVRVVSADLASVGPSQVVLSRPSSVSFSGLGLAAGGGHRGGVAWDESNGCRFIALDTDGSAPAGPVSITGPWCYWPYATADGYTTFVSPSFELAPLALVMLDANGAPGKVNSGIVPKPPAPSTTFPLARARLDDGSIALAWAVMPPAPGSPVGLAVQHFQPTGDPAAPQGVLTAFAHASTFAMTSVGTALLAVGTTVPPGTAVLSQPLDANGVPLADAATLSPDDGVAVGRVTATAVPEGALVAWTKGQAGAFDALKVQMTKADGTTMGAAVDIATPPFLGMVALARTGAGVVVAFEAEAPGTPAQVFVTRLVCAE
jgi:hypothetical protein